MHTLKVKRLDPKAKLPTVAHPGEDLAYDLYALRDATIWPGEVIKVRTGVVVSARKIREGVVRDGIRPENIRARWVESEEKLGLLVRDRSSMASKGVFTHGGVIDAGYTGEMLVIMTSLGFHHINAGDKVAQIVPVEVLTGEVVEVEEIEGGTRGEAGFGSTGR